MTSGDDELQRVTDYLTRRAGRGRRAARDLRARARAARRSAASRATGASASAGCRRRASTSASSSCSASASRACAPTWRGTRSTTSRSRPTATRRRQRASPTSRAATAAAAGSWSPTSSTAPTTRAPRSPRFRSTLRYIKRFRKALKSPRRFCGLHNYSDTNRFRDRGHASRSSRRSAAARSGSPRRAGSIASAPAGSARRRAASCGRRRYMFRLARRYPRIKRLYVYTWFGRVTPRFDAGLVARGKPRPAYYELRRRLRLRSTTSTAH